jgi:hypothetical protein
MIYHVRWKPLKDEREYNSRDHPSISEARDFACTILDQTEVFDISIVDGSGQQVIRMPEIARHCREKAARDGWR